MHFNKNTKQGISLLEVLVYVAILGVISVFISNFLISVVNGYHRARSEREVVSQARLVLETIQKSASQANEVYSPTSRFNIDGGQLSLITQIGAISTHATIYLDYWVDNGVARMRQEGSAELSLSSASVRVSKLKFERIIQSLNREAIKIILQVDSASVKFPTTITLNSTIALRGNY